MNKVMPPAYHPRIQLVQADKYASVQLEGSVEDSAKVKMRTATAERWHRKLAQCEDESCDSKPSSQEHPTR